MTKTQWDRKLKKKLAPLGKDEQRRICDYYDELYNDKKDAGLSEEEILAEFGAPEEAAAKFIEEEGGKKDNGNPVARFFLAAVLFLFVGIPLLIVLISLAAVALAVFVSGFAVIAAEVADFVYFVVQMCMFGGSGAYVAHLGIGLAAVGIGCLLIPPFLFFTKKLFILCGKLFAVTGRYIRGKKKKETN